MNSPAPIVRACTPSDLTAVRALLIETWHATYDPWLGPEKVREINDTWHAPERLLSQAEHPSSCFLLAEQVNKLVGTSFAHDLGDDEVEIGRLYVHPCFQRRGIGQALMTRMLFSFPRAHVFRLHVAPRNSAAIGLYRRNGFRIIESLPSGNLQVAGLDHDGETR